MSFLSVRNLSVRLRRGPPLLRRVSLEVAAGEVRGLVGESGAGKSMIGKAVLGILPPSVEITEGQIVLDGTDLLALPVAERRHRIGATCALIPQDPLTALNPSHRIGPQIIDRLVDILGWRRADAEVRARELLDEVQIPNAERVLRSYPHELSGGMRQRILIASAFAAEPKLIVADEPTTALDVTIQGQILAEVQKLAATTGTSLIWITHDLSVVAGLADDIAVMYAGKIVEYGDVGEVLDGPLHPYTHGLIGSVPGRNRRGEPLRQIPGMTPSLLSLQPGCAFRARCPRAQEDCSQMPELVAWRPRREARCHHPHLENVEQVA